ncbi:MAG: GAF domain-containing protein [Gemmatimonadetes bacterium]|nr:GAF domain-containing protein [Gemmatimonadota bacterium]
MNLGSVLAFLAFATLVALGAYLAGARWARAHQSAQLERANAELARRLRELFLLQELSYLLSESLEFERIVEQIARYLVRFLDAQGAVVVLADEREGGLRVAAAEGSLAGLLARAFPGPQTGLVVAALTGEKLEVADGPAPTELLPGLEARRAAVAPLRAHGVILGAIVAVDTPDPFGPDQLRLLSTVAAHAAVVLTNARLFDQLRAGKEQWESTFDALADGIAVLDDRGRIQRANRALAGLLGQPLPSVVGCDLARELLGRPSDLAGLYQAARRGERPAPVTQRSEALRRVFRISAAPMQGDQSQGRLVVLIEDVTEQKAFEAQMIQHEKMAAIGQLVSGVAHELNNPLTSVSGLAELLLEQPATPPSTREPLRIIYEQAERAGTLVRNLLTFARQGPPDVVSVDVSDVVRRTALLLEHEVRLRRVDLVTELPPEPVVVRADRMQLQQVVVNLVTNAVQAVTTNPPEHPRRVLVRARRYQDRVAIEVEDTGPGVPEELASRIFTPFFTTKEPGVGTGLGLAITYGILERHGGTLAVRRASGGGALFVAELPAAVAGGSFRDGDGASGPQHAATAGHRVLLVDGDPAVQRMISLLFSSDGHLVETARDGAHALELLTRGDYDLVIADPCTDVAGEMFAETLLARWPGLMRRAIFATADVRPETEEWLRRLGGRYVHKPVNARQLRAAAAQLLAT